MITVNLMSRAGLSVLLCVLVSCASAQANDLLVLYGSSAIWRYNGSTGAHVGKFAVSSAFTMAYGSDTNLYVATRSNVARLDGQTGAFLNVFIPPINNALEPRPADMTFGADGNLYVAGISSTSTNRGVWRYNGSTGQLIDIFVRPTDPLSNPLGLAFGPDGNLYVSDGFNVDRYNGTTGAFIDHFAHGGGLERAKEVRFGPDGNLYVKANSVLKFNGQTGAFISTLNTADAFAFGPDGKEYAALAGSVDRYTLSGMFLDHLVIPGIGAPSFPGTMVFVPEPALMMLIAAVSILLMTRRRHLVGNIHSI